jgi:hypothetical protein
MKRLNLTFPLLVSLAAGLQAQAQTAAPPLNEALRQWDATAAADVMQQAGARVKSAAELERMKAYLRDHHRGVVARHHFEMEPGIIVDCIDELTQPGAQRLGLNRATWVRKPSAAPQDLQPPTPEEAAEAASADRHGRDPGVFLQAASDVDVQRDAAGHRKSCAKGTIPKLRLSLQRLAAFETLEHFRHKLGQPGRSPRAGRLRGEQSGAQRADEGAEIATRHEYAYTYDWVTNWGAESTLNIWKAYTEKSSEFSLSQIWVADSALDETVEAGWQVYRNRHTFNPKDPYFFIFSTQDGYNQTGCYDLECNDFVQTDNSVVIGGRWTNQSVVNGNQYSTPILIQKDGSTGDWWIAVDGVYAGYYPRSLYDSSGIQSQADLVEFGGEIVNTWPDGRHTKTDMGSGYKPVSGFRYATYQRTIRYVNTSNQYATPSLSESRTDSGCYDVDSFVASGAWLTHIYFGGEGYSVSNCP